MAYAEYCAYSKRTEQILVYSQNIGMKCKQVIQRLDFYSLRYLHIYSKRTIVYVYGLYKTFIDI